jgi:iron complex outermembrane receptor protein
VGLEYHWTADLQTYATVTRGDRSGGFNGRAQSAEVALRPFNPETVTQFEIGEKSEWLDHRLRVNAAAFYSDYKDIQLTAFTISTSNSATFDTVVANAAKAKIYGGELEIAAQITSALSVNVSGGYTRNAFTNIDPSALAAGVTPGSTLPRAPEWTSSVGAEYRIPVAEVGSLTPRVDYGFTSSYDFFAQNSPLAMQRDYSITNGRLTFVPAHGSWELAIFGKNVFNRAYRLWAQSLASSLGEAIAIQGPPREWGATAKYRF